MEGPRENVSPLQSAPLHAQEQITRFHEFFEKFYYAKLLEQVRKGDLFLVVEFRKLSLFDPELAELLLREPEETLAAAELAVKEFDLPKKIERFHVRFKNYTSSSKMLIRDVRTEHLRKMMWSEGTVRQKSDVRPHVISTRFECPSCGNVLTVLQLERKYREPRTCGCGRKGKFKELAKEFIDAQGIVLEEATDELEGGEQPKRINVLLKNDLVSPLNEKRTSPGSKVRISGWITEIPTTLKEGGKSTKFDWVLEANYIEPVEEDYLDIKISKQEEDQIKELARDPHVFERLVDSIAPSIYGHEKTKEGLLLQFVGGVRKERADQTITRGDMHVLLVGDPGCGKSVLLKRSVKVAPKARYVAGQGVSAAGLCVSPNSLLITNPGEMVAIKDVVEPISGDWFQQGVWKRPAEDKVKVQTLSYDLKIHSAKPATLWKLQAPSVVFRIQTASGKKVELTGNTKLLTCKNGKLHWVKSSEVKEGMSIATPRCLLEGKETTVKIVDLIQSNPVVHNVKNRVKEIVDELSRKYGSIRNAAKKLGVKENQFYWHWTNKNARGNIKLRQFLKLAEIVGKNVKEDVREISLYNGKVHKIPQFLNDNVLYLAGLIAGDGDIRKSGETYSVRLSNATSEIHRAFRNILWKEFDLTYDVQPGNEKRPESTRTHSKILKEILEALGIPESPKSHRILFSPILLKLNNRLLSQYLAGIYDADGCVSARRTEGSHSIEYYSVAEQFARQLQFVLLRYGINSKIRSRPPTTGKIKGNYQRYCVEIRGRKNIKIFKDNVPLRHPKKKRKLEKIYTLQEGTSNIDVIPDTGRIIKKLLKQHQIRGGKELRDSIRRSTAQKLIALLPKNKEIEDIRRLVWSDIFWEKVVCVETKKPEYEYVYDITVEDTHNFVVDGIIVHNTAAVVKDEFLGGWSLEAGALVLANNGFVMIDELDKMSKEDRSAMHEALEQQSFHSSNIIELSSGEEETIGEFIEGLMAKYSERVIEGKDCLILPTKNLNLKVRTTDWKNSFIVNIERVSKHIASNYFIKITYANGRAIMVTPEHPVFVFEENKIITKEARSVQVNVLAPAPRVVVAETNAFGMYTELFCDESNIENENFCVIRIINVEKIQNTDQKWTYDITVEPHHTFISQNLILHNSVSISKANIQATLRAETTVLAAANPKLGRFNQMEPLAPQIDLPPTLINRFDLIFPVKDMPDRARDERMAKHILGLHQDPEKSKPAIPTELLRKYIAYARKTKPRIGDEAMDELKNYYVSMRNKNQREDVGMRSIPITARQLDALVRLAEASAKVRLSEVVTREDAKRSIALLEYCLMQVARDSETGQIDVDIMSTGISTTQRSKIIVFKELLAELEGKIGKTIPVEDIAEAALHHGMNRTQVDEVIEKLKRQGDIFEPKRGFVQRIT